MFWQHPDYDRRGKWSKVWNPVLYGTVKEADATEHVEVAFMLCQNCVRAVASEWVWMSIGEGVNGSAVVHVRCARV